jgi:hypothetical protein
MRIEWSSKAYRDAISIIDPAFNLPAGRTAQRLVFSLSNDFIFTNTIQKFGSVCVRLKTLIM